MRVRSLQVVLAVAGWAAVVCLLLAFRPGRAPHVHLIRMSTLGGGTGFEPAETIARVGDTLRFVNGNGGPHNVQFVPDSIADSARVQLDHAMPGPKIGPMSSPLFLDTGEVYEFAVPALPPGRYPFVCLPHHASMAGALLVTR